MSWTPEEDQITTRMLKAGAPLTEIAGTLGTKTPKQVGLRRQKLGFAVPSKSLAWTEDKIKRVRRMYTEGKSYALIAKTIGCDTETVWRKCKELKLPPRERSAPVTAWTQEMDDTLMRLVAEGKTCKEIATVVGRTAKAVQIRKRILQTPEEAVEPKIPIDLPDDTRSTYWRAHSQAATIEMVIFTLWKIPPRERVISIEDAAVKLVRLIGHGDGYFWMRRDWTIRTWIRHLSNLTEGDMP